MKLYDAIEDLEKKLIVEALGAGDHHQAAKTLGISLPTLRQYIAKFNLNTKHGEKNCILCSQQTDSLIPETEFDMKALMESIEKTIVVEALGKFNNNQTAAARFLKMPVYAFRYLAEKHGM